MSPMMSMAQSKWMFTPAGMKKMGGKKKVMEFAGKTDYSKLPERVGKKNRKGKK